MALQQSQPAAVGGSERWVLTPVVAQTNGLPGTLLIPEGRKWFDITQVIFMVPDMPVQIDRVLRKLEAIDMPRKTPIILVELAGRRKDAARQRRFDALVAQIRAVFPAASGERLCDQDWLTAMRTFARRQDLLIVAAGQQLSQGVFSEQPLGRTLQTALDLPVLEITGIFQPWHSLLLDWFKNSLFNLFPFLVVAVFFWIQAQVGQQTQGWVSTFAISTTVIIEIILVFFWSLFLD